MNSSRDSSVWADPWPLATLRRETTVLPRAFYTRPTIEVAHDLIGKVILHGKTAGRIIEAEAYLGLEDKAAHSSAGVTNRTRAIFGPPGHAYVYLIYGMYECLNLVAEPDGTPGCVLIRALEPITGLAIMRPRRTAARRPEQLASGPGKLTMALDVTRRHYGADVTRGPLIVRGFREESPLEVVTTPRIGITKCVDWPLRFVLKS